MTYARARLWLGVSCFGTLVLLAIFALIFKVPNVALQTEKTNTISFLTNFFAFTSFFFLIIAPFDLPGGYAFPKEYHRYSPKNIRWFLFKYVRGVLPKIFVFCIAGLLLTFMYSILGYIGLALTAFLLGSLFILFQPAISFIVSGIKHFKPEKISENW
ncbi:MAG: hypothetical protein AB8G05_00820 [Oligoflexales bacterium]